MTSTGVYISLSDLSSIYEEYEKGSVEDFNELQAILHEKVGRRIHPPYQQDGDPFQEYEAMDTGGVIDDPGRVDRRDLPTVTIDPGYAHDHDDAMSIVPRDDGVTVYAHIADVGHYVDPDSAIAEAAQDRCVTFYLGGNTRHMLPPPLAQEICSLAPGKEKRALTIEMAMDERGGVDGVDIYRSVVESDAHLTYDDVDRIRAGNDWEFMSGIHEQVELFDTLTARMREDRWDQSLILNSDDAAGSRMVEETMIAANVATGQYIAQEGLDGVYRVEPAPDPGWMYEAEEKIQESEALQEAGVTIPADWHEGNPIKTVNDFFWDEVDDTVWPDARDAVIPTLQRAMYEAPVGGPHFALGVEDYVQTTSPIRRLSDLLVHWIIAGDVDFDAAELSDIAEDVSIQYHMADAASYLWYDANG